ncbi:hypothetical protein [Tardiphaga robiniae]|uniref:Uncharacterized protein n=1 Tax=Tardiphaga robiniae TaxID=943830 RepID=A0A7G6TVN2_9BRAD|nr:hypothetical protein [Tardiphaga robiniae]QND70814.1 hypothetical protein HB776_05875 [Tardiphaga robiniae]
MAKLFECECGIRWLCFIGRPEQLSECCKKPMTPVDDGQPDPPTRLELKEAVDLIRKENEDD